MTRGSFLFIFFLSIFFGFAIQDSYGQKSKNQLEKEKAENLKRISEAQRILQETEKRKEASLGQLSAIRQQIKIREELINGIQGEVNLLNNEIDETNEIINSLNEDLDQLKKEYASMVYAAYKANQGYQKLIFLFSATSFNQFMMRLDYMEQYGKERRNQVKEIEMVSSALEDQLAVNRQKREEKNKLLNEQIQENQKLSSLNERQSATISSLNKKESELRKEVADRKAANDKLEKMIAAIVAEEIRKSSAKNSNSNKMTLTPEAARLSESFAGNIAKLPWPVESGFISREFGEHPHPVLKRVKVNNKGVYIQTKPHEPVRVVFDGQVTQIVVVQGMHNAVLIRHGEFLTVYANLDEVSVSTGQKVSTKDVIGTVYTDSDGTTELYFQIWKNNNILNPQLWLTRR